MAARIGELAALGTAVSWTIAALVMEQAVKRVGVMAVNTLKVAFGTVYLATLAYFMTGSLFPSHLPPSAWVFLGASGFVGFVIGDYFLLHAYMLVGSSMAMLLMSLSVPLTAIASFLIFGETLGPWSLAGITLCVSGISITVSAGWKKNPDKAPILAGQSTPGNMRYVKGIIFGALSAVCMAAATLLTKAGAVGINTVSATQIRIASALIGFILFALATGKLGEIEKAFHHRSGLPLIAAGGIFGPFIGVGLLLFALQNANAGIVSTLSSLTPVLIIPPLVIFFGRRIRLAEVIGACLAVIGLALLFL